MLVDPDLWVAISRTKPTSMKQEDWELMDWKAKGLIILCLANFFLLNFHEEKNSTSMWKNLGDVY